MTSTLTLPQPAGPFATFCREFLAFGFKEARACIFVVLFFATLAISTKLPLGPLPRYDFILLMAIAIQLAMLVLKLETLDELKTIMVFHVLGFALEVFKTNPAIGSWSYPEFAYAKLFGVPLYSGFMYSAIASYIAQAWRILDLKLTGYPSYRASIPLCVAIYLNFFTHHYLPDCRWVLTLVTIFIFRHTRVHFRPIAIHRQMPLLASFGLIGFFIWLGENIGSFFRAWQYPNQAHGWAMVHWGKISSWSLLVILSIILIADLKHYKTHLRHKAGRNQSAA